MNNKVKITLQFLNVHFVNNQYLIIILIKFDFTKNKCYYKSIKKIFVMINTRLKN